MLILHTLFLGLFLTTTGCIFTLTRLSQYVLCYVFLPRLNMKQRLKQHQQLLENILSLSVLQVLNIVLPLITLPYLMTVVGKGNYGAYAVAFSMVNYITLVSAYGFGFSATKQISQHRDDIRTVSKIFSSVLVAKMFLAIISALPFLVISFFAFGAKYSLMVALGLGIVLGELLNPVWLFQGMENMKFMKICLATKII